MGVYESYTKIKKAATEMDAVWDRTKQVWKDEKSRQFEEEFINRLSFETKKAETAISNIGVLLNRIRSEFRD